MEIYLKCHFCLQKAQERNAFTSFMSLYVTSTCTRIGVADVTSVHLFAPFKEENLCRAWLFVKKLWTTRDNLNMWRKAHQEFNEIERNLERRTMRSLKLKWETIRAAVLLFERIMIWLKIYHANIIDTELGRINTSRQGPPTQKELTQGYW